MAQPQSQGRKDNAAQPLGERSGLIDKKDTEKTAAREQRSAGPDGPDARDTSPDRGPASKTDAFEGPAGDPAEGRRP